MQRPLRIAERPPQPVEGLAVGVVAIHVAQQPGEAAHRRRVRILDEFTQALAHPLGEPVDIGPLTRDADDRNVEQLPAHQLVERRVDLAITQVAGCPE